jgi:hypothetical protein
MPFAHFKNVHALTCATDPSGTGAIIVFSGSSDGRIRYWMYDATSQVFSCVGLMEGHSRGITRLKAVQLGGTMAYELYLKVAKVHDFTIDVYLCM